MGHGYNGGLILNINVGSNKSTYYKKILIII